MPSRPLDLVSSPASSPIPPPVSSAAPLTTSPELLIRSRSRYSLRVRLTLIYTLVLSLVLLLTAASIYISVQATLRASLDVAIEEAASLARASLKSQGQLPVSADLPPGDLLIELLGPRGEIQSAIGYRPPSAATLPTQPGWSVAGNRRVLAEALPQGWLRVSRPVSTDSELLDVLTRVLVAGSGVMLLLAAVAGYLFADRALRPVDAVARTAADIARQGTYRERVPQAPGQDELARLTHTVNEMLDRLEGTIEREKTFARTAAHELRTPLTVIKGRLDLTLSRPRRAQEYARALETMRGRVDELVMLVEALLNLARSDTPPQLESLELAALALEVSDDLDTLGQHYGKVVRLSVQESWVRAEAGGVRQLLTNLLENAFKYGDGERVTLEVGPQRLRVTSGGAGPDPADWPRLIQPFERGGGVRGLPGSGLGLALVAALCARWDARLAPGWDGQGEAATFTVEVAFQPAAAPPGAAFSPG